jgi:hypothetical protein
MGRKEPTPLGRLGIDNLLLTTGNDTSRSRRPCRRRSSRTAPEHRLGDGDPAGFDLREGARIVFQAPGHGSYPMHIKTVQQTGRP